MVLGSDLISGDFFSSFSSEKFPSRTFSRVDLKDSNAIKEKLELLLENEDLLIKMKINGRRRAEELYDEKKVVDLQLNIIKKLVIKK